MENIDDELDGNNSQAQMSRSKSGDSKLEDIPADDAEILDNAIMEEDIEDPLDI